MNAQMFEAMHTFMRPTLRSHNNGRNNALHVLLKWREWEFIRGMLCSGECPQQLKDALEQMPKVKEVRLSELISVL